jgi:hypothetical protein
MVPSGCENCATHGFHCPSQQRDALLGADDQRDDVPDLDRWLVERRALLSV